MFHSLDMDTLINAEQTSLAAALREQGNGPVIGLVESESVPTRLAGFVFRASAGPSVSFPFSVAGPNLLA
jgi:hypothetical protein